MTLRVRPQVLLALLLAASAALTLVYWRGISFQSRLGDEDLAEALSETSPSRRALHGVEEMTRRWAEGREGMDRWIERLVLVSRRPEANVRRVAAWGMQAGARDPAVAARLAEMVASDPDETARRNAATSLSGAADPSPARPVLRSMLEPFVVRAPAAGRLETLAEVGRRPEADDPLGRIAAPTGLSVPLVAPVPGRVVERRAEPGADVAAGAELLVLAPDVRHVMNAVTALAAAGTRDDVAAVRRWAAPQPGVPPELTEQARRAADAIEARSR